MLGVTNYEARIREAQEDGAGGKLGHGFYGVGNAGNTLFNTLSVGRAFYREMLDGEYTKEAALEEARRNHPEVVWEMGSKEKAHMLVAGTGRFLPGAAGDGDELVSFGRALVGRALAPEGVWHVCWVSEGADVRWAGTPRKPGTPPVGYVGHEEEPDSDAMRLYLEELGEDFPGEIAWDEPSAVELLGALTCAARDEKFPRRKNTLVVVERPRSHAVLDGVRGLIATARGQRGTGFGAGVHVVVLTESPGSLPTGFMRLFGQRLAFPVTAAASRDVLGGSEDAATLGKEVEAFDGGKLPYAPAVLHDRERGVRDVFVGCAPGRSFEGLMERLSHRCGGTRAGRVIGEEGAPGEGVGNGAGGDEEGRDG